MGSAHANDPHRTGQAAIAPAIVQQAAVWVARLWSGEASDADRAACARWRAAHPDHERAWSRLQAMEDKLCSVPRDVARHALLTPATNAPATRRRALQLLGLAAVAGGAAYTLRESEAWHIATADHSTGTGEIREISLPDGTRVVLNTATAINVRFDSQERRIVLRAGEILATTAPDPAPVHRPLLVQSRHGTVRALGTRFSVRQDGEASHVAVFQGAVEIRPTHANATAVRVEAGQASVFSADQAQPPFAIPQSAAAWSQGSLLAENMRVADFVAELGRYRPGLLRCDPAVADLRVSGVFSLRDTDRALINLTLGLPLKLVYRTRYWVTVQAR